MAEDEVPDRLAVVRWNIARHRKAAGLSQADVSEAMTGRGFKWFPQTVQKIENGSRTLRFDEAVELTKVLGIELWELLQKPAEDYLSDEVVRFQRAQRRIGEAVTEAIRAQERAAIIVDELGDMGVDEAADVLASHPLVGAHGPLASSTTPIWETNRLAILVPDGPVLPGRAGELMTEREPANLTASPDGASVNVDALFRRRREWFGESGEEPTDGFDPETS